VLEQPDVVGERDEVVERGKRVHRYAGVASSSRRRVGSSSVKSEP
jgi:hypothetical protein